MQPFFLLFSKFFKKGVDRKKKTVNCVSLFDWFLFNFYWRNVMRVLVLMAVLLSAGGLFANGGKAYSGLVSFSHVGDGCRDISDGEYIVEISANHSQRRMYAQVWFFSKAEPLAMFKIVGNSVFWGSDAWGNDPDTSGEPDGEVTLDGKGGTVVDYRIGDYASMRFAFTPMGDGSMVIAGEQKVSDKDCVMNFIGTVN